MGTVVSSPEFTQEELEEYEAVTCLNAAEVLDLYDKFTYMDGERPKADAQMDEEDGSEAQGTKVKLKFLLQEEEFKNNPLAKRLFRVFSSEPKLGPDGEESPSWGDLSFDEYVDMFNCLSPRASKEVKMQTAFRMYDFDGNGYVTAGDLEELLICLATPPPKWNGKKRPCLMAQHEMEDIIKRVMRDCDVDGNHRLSYAEFSKVQSRIPDFCRKFSVQVAS